MKVLAIRKLVEKYTISELREAEYAIIQEKPLSIQVDGKDQAEKLTNLIASVWILEEMRNHPIDFREALSEYTKKLRGYQEEVRVY